MAYYPWARYPPYSYDDTWLRTPANTELALTPSSSTRPLYYEDDYWNVPRHGPAWPGMAPAFVPLPPSPTIMASMVPLPPSPYVRPQGSPHGSPRVSPRMGLVALPPAAYPAYLPVNPYYVPNVPTPYLYPGSATPRSQIHPLLNGESQRFELIFDLSASKPRPQVPSPHASFSFTSSSRIDPTPIHPGHLEQTATYPPTTHISITCAALSPFTSDWVIRVGEPGAGRHVSVGSVLKAIHTSLQKQISHVEWAKLSENRAAEVSEAYTRRCRSLDSFSSAVEFERNQGVRRIDFLADRYYFAGLVRTKVDDVECLKLTVKERPKNLK
ncbi:hypothetical protein BD410DRAFT_785282 [Rickenella mellea]|uniref:DUF6699 domain-containing protein n=1 Tax=Rickenella mellea TaxID=50990 RepID=A0A4Y7QDL1_9AGAM|nr:hypothetical protein BD410DRAFT_785282 [Rickenella mellea]